MSDLAEWLLACIAEDEDAAPDIHHRDCESVQFDYGGVALGPCNCGEPVQVLADLAAKRRIVEVAADDDMALEWILCLLALPYADCEGYDERWRPEQ